MNSGLASLHKILKDETRRKIVLLLNEKDSLSYTDLLKTLEIDNTGRMNYHLKVLNDLVLKKEDGQYALSEKGKLASRLLLEFPERNRKQLGMKPKWWRKFWLGNAVVITALSLVISVSFFLGYINSNEVYRGIVSIAFGVAFSYMLQHIIRDVLSKKSQLTIAKTGYIAGGIVLGLGIAFFGVGILFRVLSELSGKPLLYTIFWSDWYLIFSLLIAPTIGAIAMYRFGKKRRFRTPNYIPD